jgi:LacI family transcriptional regulator
MKNEQIANIEKKRISVSEGTISRIVNGRKVEEVVLKGTAPKKAPNCIAVIIRGTQNIFLVSIVAKLQYYVEQNGFQFILHYIDERQNELLAARRICAEKSVQAIIFLGGNPKGREDELQALQIPCVFSTQNAFRVELPNVYSVGVDDRAAAKAAIDYLFQKGHRKIVVIGGSLENENATYYRWQGVKDSFAARGLPVDDKMYMTANFSMASAYDAMKRALVSGVEFSAVFALSDSMAIGAAKAALDSGRKIPGDISVVGYDGIEMTQFYNPPITTIRQPIGDIARASVDLLMKALSHMQHHAHITVPFELVEGRSVKTIR